MLKVTTLLIFSILTGQAYPTEAVNTEVYLPSSVNKTQYIYQDESHLLCSESGYKFTQLYCNQSRPLLERGYCVTFNEKTKILSIFNCPYFQFDRYYLINYHGNIPQIMMPLLRNLTELNDYMCDPMNRKGLVCSECADGFGPSVTSFGYRCANCSEMRYTVPLFLFLEFVPLSTFYLICLIFHIHVTSAPMPCFIMLAQIIIFTFDSANLATPALKKVIPRSLGSLAAHKGNATVV